MESQPENFENLRRLLALKRHEQPPPGYFEDFSRGVFLRLQEGESSRAIGWDSVTWEAPWLHRLWEALSGKPMLTGAFGVAACALVLGGVLYAERLELPAMANNGVAQAAMNLPGGAPALFNQPLDRPELVSNTNSSIQPNIPSGLFGGVINPELASRPFNSLGGN